jgi:hypothetical protein
MMKGVNMQVGSIIRPYASPFATQTARPSDGASTDFANVVAAQSTTPTATLGPATFSSLTEDDKSVIKTAIGITLAADGSVAENTTGEFPDWRFIDQINDDRHYGRLEGPVNSTYFQNLIADAPLDTPASHLRNLNTALDFLLARENGRASERVDVVA